MISRSIFAALCVALCVAIIWMLAAVAVADASCHRDPCDDVLWPRVAYAHDADLGWVVQTDADYLSVAGQLRKHGQPVLALPLAVEAWTLAGAEAGPQLVAARAPHTVYLGVVR